MREAGQTAKKWTRQWRCLDTADGTTLIRCKKGLAAREGFP